MVVKQTVTGAVIASIITIGLTGCMSDLTGTTYSREEARQAQTVQFGTITEVQWVKLQGSDSGVGAIAGGAAGGIAAHSNIGSGSGSTVAAIAGAVAGGVLGNMAEEKLTQKQGVELTIRLEYGGYLSVVQQADPKIPFAVGDKVKILGQSSATRVVKMQ